MSNYESLCRSSSGAPPVSDERPLDLLCRSRRALGIDFGFYALLSYAVLQRTAEIGVRMAMGASRSVIVRMIVLYGMKFTSAGLVIGLFLALALRRVAAGFLYGISPAIVTRNLLSRAAFHAGRGGGRLYRSAGRPQALILPSRYDGSSGGMICSPSVMSNFLNTVILALLAIGPLAAAIKQPIRVQGGLVSGVPGSDRSVLTFKGIPFAAPPVGDSRWREPQPVNAWQGVRPADKFSAGCIQRVVGERKPWTSEFMTHGDISEDCLYLNVWTAAASAGAATAGLRLYLRRRFL